MANNRSQNCLEYYT